MNLQEFLKKVNWKETDIINYSWDEVLEAVKQDWDALRFVNKNIFIDYDIILNWKK